MGLSNCHILTGSVQHRTCQNGNLGNLGQDFGLQDRMIEGLGTSFQWHDELEWNREPYESIGG